MMSQDQIFENESLDDYARRMAGGRTLDDLRKTLTDRKREVNNVLTPEQSEKVKAYSQKVFNSVKAEPQKMYPTYKQEMEYDEARRKVFDLLKSRHSELCTLKQNPDFKIEFTDQQAQTIRNLIKWYINDASGELPLYKGFWLFGKPGTFKTEITKILCKFAQNERLSKAASYEDLTLIHTAVTNNPDNLERYKAMSRVFDEFLREMSPVQVYGNKIHVPEWIIANRYTYFKGFGQPSGFVSNYGPHEAKKNLSEMAFDRLSEMVTSIEMPGLSNRRN